MTNEQVPSSPNIRAYPNEKKYVRSIRQGEEREPDIIRRICNHYKKTGGKKR